MQEKQRDGLATIGTILVVLGVAVWGVYAILRWGLDVQVSGRQFLPYHLAGVIPGMLLRRRRLFASWIKRFF